MIINTKEFGQINVEKECILDFKSPILGFEGYSKFIIINNSDMDSMMYLQSVENGDLYFVIVDPYAIFSHYAPKLSKDDYNNLDITINQTSKLRYMLIAIITEDVECSVVNLKSPIVINTDNKNAIQAVLQNQDYPLRYPLFQKKAGI